MARMHSRKKGKSGSKKPVSKEVPSWVSIDKKELELLIAKLAKQGKSTSEIGLILRDSYGVPSARNIINKKLQTFVKEKKLTKNFPDDLRALMVRALALRKHFENNKQDMSAKRGMQLTDSKINRLVKYYKETKILEPTFKYKPSELNVYLQ